MRNLLAGTQNRIHPGQEENEVNDPSPIKSDLWIQLLTRIDEAEKYIRWFVDSPDSYFNSITLSMIVLNSLVLACTDYSNVDENYQPSSNGSTRNTLAEISEIFFIFVFLIECIFKIVAYGFISGKKSYLRRDSWNRIDFLVVVARYV